METMTQKEALDKVRKMFGQKLTTGELFDLYDIISAVNLHGWKEGNKRALTIFAPDVAKILHNDIS